jgi:hypothetical protein
MGKNIADTHLFPMPSTRYDVACAQDKDAGCVRGIFDDANGIECWYGKEDEKGRNHLNEKEI